jgi:pyruvate,orthophosphate dikinase
MIELPRAALRPDEIAAGEDGAEFFSFGTNDLTQTCIGLSRDDAAPILANYTQQAICEVDPFVSIDQDGVGELVRIGTERGRKVRGRPQGRHLRRARRRPRLDRLLPRSRPRLRVLTRPSRVPVARLAAAQAAIRAKRGSGAADQAPH